MYIREGSLITQWRHLTSSIILQNRDYPVFSLPLLQIVRWRTVSSVIKTSLYVMCAVGTRCLTESHSSASWAVSETSSKRE